MLDLFFKALQSNNWGIKKPIFICKKFPFQFKKSRDGHPFSHKEIKFENKNTIAQRKTPVLGQG
jgi:hypothetical protein